MYQISTAAMRETITRLRLEKGDVLLVRHAETMDYLSKASINLEFNVPLVFCPGGIETMKRQDLLNILEQLDQSDKSVLPPYEISGPAPL